jgi:hypothetical protein
MPPAVHDIIVIMNNNDDDVSASLTKTPERKKGRSATEEDETGTNTVSTYTESEQYKSPASNIRLAEKQKASTPLDDTDVPSDSEDIKGLVDAGKTIKKQSSRCRKIQG